MKSLRICLLLTMVIMLHKHSALAQADSIFLDPKIDIEVILPRFDSLYKIALKVNPTQKQELAGMRSYIWTERYTRWMWAQNISVFYNYSFGSLPFFAYATTNGPNSTGLTQVTSGYRAGVQIQLSVFDVLGHRGRVNEVKEKVLLQKYKAEAEAMELRRKLAQFYTDMVAYNKLYKGRNEDLITQTLACSVAEKEWREGTIHISEWARQKNVLADSEAAYNESFRFYYSSLMQFEAILGVPLISLVKKKKGGG